MGFRVRADGWLDCFISRTRTESSHHVILIILREVGIWIVSIRVGRRGDDESTHRARRLIGRLRSQSHPGRSVGFASPLRPSSDFFETGRARAARRKSAFVGRTKRNETVSRTQSDARARAKTRVHETDDGGISSLTHTATKRRPAMTKGSTERDADEPTREDKDAGPSARASTGKRASIASTKVRFHDDYECGSFRFFPRVDGRTRTYEPSVQSARLVVLGGAFASLRAASDIVVIDVIDRWIDRSIVIRRSREIFFAH